MHNCEYAVRSIRSLSEAYCVHPDHAGDQICIFGFSRGAYTARALAGMVQKVGLLPQWNVEQLPFACAMYEKDDDAGVDLSLQFKRTFSIDVRIKFLGVWYVMRPSINLPSHIFVQGHCAIRGVGFKGLALLQNEQCH